MTCEEVRISLGAHALGALDPEEAAEIDHHLATCEACGAELLELEESARSWARCRSATWSWWPALRARCSTGC
ncbi:anti-sigma factor family protein [Nonomuraea rubra]|uniref:anti-sigma factor family protein n=1 Tax=Nonomuraea rubra TaxID=46180 RepID=UPI00360D39C9